MGNRSRFGLTPVWYIGGMKVSEPALKPDERFTYADYAKWPDEERWELIEGEAFNMSPAPKTAHQRIVVRLTRILDTWFEDKPCTPFVSPVDVVLPEPGQDWRASKTVVQPDLLVVCDPAKIVPEAIVGAPDFVIEVLSPSTAFRDQTEKRVLYERHGVREYWLINPDTLEVFAYTLRGKAFDTANVYSLKTGVEVSIFPGLFVQKQ